MSIPLSIQGVGYEKDMSACLSARAKMPFEIRGSRDITMRRGGSIGGRSNPGKNETICDRTSIGSVGVNANGLPESNPKVAKNILGLFDMNLPVGIP